MARQQAAQRSVEGRHGSAGGSSSQSTSSDLIVFEPELAVRAIVFHLVDEGVANQVADDSARAAVTRLRRAGCRPSVEPWVWSEMTNPQRLEWLMEKTQTAARLVSDELSVLEAAPKK